MAESASKKVTPETIIRYIMNHYADSIQVHAAADEIDVDYDLTMDIIATRIAHEKSPEQIRNIFGKMLHGENEIYRFIESELPGLYDACETFASRNYKQDRDGNVIRKI